MFIIYLKKKKSNSVGFQRNLQKPYCLTLKTKQNWQIAK